MTVSSSMKIITTRNVRQNVPRAPLSAWFDNGREYRDSSSAKDDCSAGESARFGTMNPEAPSSIRKKWRGVSPKPWIALHWVAPSRPGAVEVIPSGEVESVHGANNAA